jgi:hypothetical protein
MVTNSQLYDEIKVLGNLHDKNGNSIIVLNRYHKFLQCVDVLVNILKTDYNSPLMTEINYRGCDMLTQYFLMAFLMSS